MTQLRNFIFEKYPNGFRNDELGFGRLRKQYIEHFGTALPEREFGELLSEEGIRVDNKIYWITTTLPLAEILFSATDVGLFYYKTVFEKHRNVLTDIHIYSPKLLKAVLEEKFPYLVCREEYFFDKSFVKNIAHPALVPPPPLQNIPRRKNGIC